MSSPQTLSRDLVEKIILDHLKEQGCNVPDDSTNPDHYKQGDIECIDYIKSVLTKEEYIGYLQGNITKYLHRWKNKNGVEDLDKAHVYLNWLIEEVGEDA